MDLEMPRPGTDSVSEELRSFVEEMPFERRSILAFVRKIADSQPAGTVVFDVGAGQAPYRELFAHCEYVATDWANSVHERARYLDVIAPATALPFPDHAADAVLLTQLLEHVPEPAAVLAEAARVLRPGGSIYLTVPFVWELHELPFDFWRFTPPSLQKLLDDAGFLDPVIEPRNDCFTTVAQLLRNLRWVMGSAPDGRNEERSEAADLLDDVATRISKLAPLDSKGILPLGWTVTARRHG